MEYKKPSVFVKNYKVIHDECKTVIYCKRELLSSFLIQEGVDRVKRGNYAFLMESTMLDYVSSKTNCDKWVAKYV